MEGFLFVFCLSRGICSGVCCGRRWRRMTMGWTLPLPLSSTHIFVVAVVLTVRPSGSWRTRSSRRRRRRGRRSLTELSDTDIVSISDIATATHIAVAFSNASRSNCLMVTIVSAIIHHGASHPAIPIAATAIASFVGSAGIRAFRSPRGFRSIRGVAWVFQLCASRRRSRCGWSLHFRRLFQRRRRSDGNFGVFVLLMLGSETDIIIIIIMNL
mmetsp:Transcript_15930/g.33432  ORF Transcript_15930/g.33432 Transcript_15930/m.33432 type:complete len:213 (-) Transcript_15930:1600-2238(-)